METTTETIDDRERLIAEARRGVEHGRLPRAAGAGHAPTGRARCRSCRQLIEKGGWRIALVYYDEGRFDPSGFIDVRCARDYFGAVDLVGRLSHFSPELDDTALADLRAELEAPAG